MRSKSGMARYVQCLVCGRLTPDDKGICYHCDSPLPSELDLPPGFVICPNCLRVTAADTGYCRHCRARLPVAIEIPPLSEEKKEIPPGGDTSANSDPKVGAISNPRKVGVV